VRCGSRGSVVVAAAALALPVLLSACQSRQETYCDSLRQERQTFVELGREVRQGRAGVVTDGIAVFEQLREEAPGDLRDEWDTFLRAWQGLASALERADASESVLRDGEQPPGVSDEEYAAIQDAAAQLVETRVLEAASGIEQHARDVCDVELTRSRLQ
jgi:hypothetical protein